MKSFKYLVVAISGMYYKNILMIVSDDCKLCLYYKCALPQPWPQP
jgi:hypothetical protein